MSTNPFDDDEFSNPPSKPPSSTIGLRSSHSKQSSHDHGSIGSGSGGGGSIGSAGRDAVSHRRSPVPVSHLHPSSHSGHPRQPAPHQHLQQQSQRQQREQFQQREQHQQHSAHALRGGRNERIMSHPSHASQQQSHLSHATQHQPQHHEPRHQQQNQKPQVPQTQQEPPIFSARGVEWPLPTAVNPSSYRKFRKESKASGASLGILASLGGGIKIESSYNYSNYESHTSYGGGGGNFAAGMNETSAFMPKGDASVDGTATVSGGASVSAGTVGTSGNASGGGSTSGYGGLTGLMGRVLGASSQSASAGGSLSNRDIEDEDLSLNATRPILAPRAKCVSASNGWIVAAVECPPPPMNNLTNMNFSSSASVASGSTSGYGGSAMSTSGGSTIHGGHAGPTLSKSGIPLIAYLPPLRLVSRWNVRRGTTSLGENNLVPLPPPVRPTLAALRSVEEVFSSRNSGNSGMLDKASGGAGASSTVNTTNMANIANIAAATLSNDPNFGRILHTFVDPTGCHVLLSAQNGELYYLHSTAKKVKKLVGFGPGVDGMYNEFQSGVALGDVGGVNGSTSGYGVGDSGGNTVGETSGDRTGDGSGVQTGITPGSYVTAVGWDRDRGTEGSTKRILLGTSLGELYEYALVSPNATSSASTSSSPFSVKMLSGAGGGEGLPGVTASSGTPGTKGLGKGLVSGGVSGMGGGLDSKSSAFDTRAGELDGEEPMDAPVLLRRLHGSIGVDGGAVGGILFQRIGGAGGIGGASHMGRNPPNSGYVIVLASTGGPHRHTRLHTFRSESSASSLSLRSAFLKRSTAGVQGSKGKVNIVGSVGSGVSRATPGSSKSQDGSSGHTGQSAVQIGSFVELPGSVDFAELRSCNDGFALRTETGIYYGTLERAASMGTMSTSVTAITTTSVTESAGGVVGGIFDAGMLPYDSIQGGQSGNVTIKRKVGGGTNETPSSIGLTPHHFITLTSTNEVRFINRVARKVIQQERVDWVSVSQGGDETGILGGSGAGLGTTIGGGGAGMAELLMDVRRPDQIWLRKSRNLVHISSSCEDRDVWKFTLAKCIEPTSQYSGSLSSQRSGVDISMSSRHLISKADTGSTTTGGTGATLTPEEKYTESQFEHAKSLCSTPAQKAVVNAVRAEYHLALGHVELAAKYMAQCPGSLMPFGSTAARLALPMLGPIGPNSTHGAAGSHGGVEESLSQNLTSKAKEALSQSNMALITFLTDKMKIAKSKNDTVVCTILGAWLTELHLQERERDGCGGSVAGQPVYVRQHEDKYQSSKPLARKSSQKYGMQQPVNPALLHQFLSTFVRDMEARTIVKVLGSHDINAAECAGYAATAADVGAAVNAALWGEDGKNGALDALRVLNDSPMEKSEPYYYKHALTLLSRAPMAASKSFLSRYSDGLSETKLLPSFMQYERKRVENKKAITAAAAAKNAKKLSGKSSSEISNSSSMGGMKVSNLEIEKSRTGVDGEVEIHIDPARTTLSGSFVDDENASIKYLEGVIKLGCKSRAIYNYLVSLYANIEDEGPLFRFLSANVPTTNAMSSSLQSLQLSNAGVNDLLVKLAHDEGTSPLDKSFALRTILRTGRHFRSAVKLYMGFGMRQQAVELALKVDPSLARELARQSEDKDERKRLWLMIARNAAANGTSRDGKDVVARVVLVLKDCGPDVLSIEDVLPFLPDFAQIDQFKDEICEALASYSSKIEHYLKEMNECDQTCDALRDELSRLRTVGTHVRADARCAFTNKSILDSGEPFYVFPSGYVVLEDALKQEVMPYLNDRQRARVNAIESELAKLRKKRNSRNRAANELAKYDYEMEELQVELDGLIAAECPLTGSIMVESIDRGFSDDEDDFFV